MQNAYEAVSNAAYADMKDQMEALQTQNRSLNAENARLLEHVAVCNAEKQDMFLRHEKAAETFAHTIESIVSRKRARSATPPPAAGSSAQNEADHQAGIDRFVGYADHFTELQKEEHAKAIKSMEAKHHHEVSLLRAKAAEPINEFRISKQFHIKEAELVKEVQQLKHALEEETKKSSAAAWDTMDRLYTKRDLVEMKKQCADRGQLLARISELEAMLKKEEDRMLEGDPRTESHVQLQERVEALKVSVCMDCVLWWI